MSSDLDKFVLQYQVDLKDSVRKLEELHKKMEGVQKAHKESAGQLKDFIGGVSNELNKLIPGIDAVGVAVRGMGAQFTIAAAALGALAISVKAVLDLREKFTQQHDLGVKIGMSGAMVEEYQRKFVRAGGGYVDRAGAAKGLEDFEAMARAAYSNPMSAEAQRMKMLGVKVGEWGKAPTSTREMLSQAGTHLAGLDPVQAQAISQVTGLNNEWILTLQRLGPEVSKVTEMTLEDLKARQQAQKDIDKLNNDMKDFKEATQRLSEQIGMLVAGPMAKFISAVARVVENINKLKPSEKTDLTLMAAGGMPGLITGGTRLLTGRIKDWWNGRGKTPETPMTPEEEQAAREEIMKNLNMTAETSTANAKQINNAINQFSGAVQTFSSAVDIQQAWAAWAGEIGKAGGIRGASNDGKFGGSAVASKSAGGTAESVIQQLMGLGWSREQAAGIAANFQMESQFNPGASGDGGKAYGIGQWHPDRQANFKKWSGKDIQGSTLAEQVAFAHYELTQGGEQAAGRALRNATSAYDAGSIVSKKYERPARVEWDAERRGQLAASYGRGPARGESRSSVQLDRVQQTMADYLKLSDVSQLKDGDMSRGDVRWAYDQTMAGLQNSLAGLRKQALNKDRMTTRDYGALMDQIRDQEAGINLMKQYGPSVIDKQQEGGRTNLTLGERAIVININGAVDPVLVGDVVDQKLRSSMNTLLTGQATGTKG